MHQTDVLLGFGNAIVLCSVVFIKVQRFEKTLSKRHVKDMRENFLTFLRVQWVLAHRLEPKSSAWQAVKMELFGEKRSRKMHKNKYIIIYYVIFRETLFTVMNCFYYFLKRKKTNVRLVLVFLCAVFPVRCSVLKHIHRKWALSILSQKPNLTCYFLFLCVSFCSNKQMQRLFFFLSFLTVIDFQEITTRCHGCLVF